VCPPNRHPSIALAVALLAVACGSDKPPAAMPRDAGPRLDAGASDASTTPDATTSPDAALDDAGALDAETADAAIPCTGTPPECFEILEPLLCTTLVANGLCESGEWRCPTGYVLPADCPTNDAMCPAGDSARFEMHDDRCDLPVDIECFYEGPAGVPCRGNLYGCTCDGDPTPGGRRRWSCVCLL
jgi:hypothetical protein